MDIRETILKSRYRLILALILSLIGFAFLWLRYGYEQVWQLWNIPTMTPHFADLRTITGLSVTLAQGYNPMVENPGDPWQRPFNYPPIWKILPRVGVKPEHTTLLGLLIIGSFLVGLCLPFANLTWHETAFLMAGVLSPAVLLGVERANTDLLLFFMIALAVWLSDKSLLWTAAVIQTAIFLKLYPLFCLPLLVRAPKKPFLLSAAIILGVTLLYVWVNFGEILRISEATPHSYNLSYGVSVLPQRLERSPYAHYAAAARVLTSITAAVLILLGVWFSRKIELTSSYLPARYLDAFRAGSAIYIGTFFLGSNFDYRLVFLLLTIPQLIQWAQERQVLTRRLAQITLAALYLSLWHRMMLRGLEWLLPKGFPGSFSRALAFFPD